MLGSSALASTQAPSNMAIMIPVHPGTSTSTSAGASTSASAMRREPADVSISGFARAQHAVVQQTQAMGLTSSNGAMNEDQSMLEIDKMGSRITERRVREARNPALATGTVASLAASLSSGPTSAMSVAAQRLAALDEQAIRRLSMDDLAKQGLGRHETGVCYSSKMKLHAPLRSREEDNDPHPEQPDRITSIYNLFAANGVMTRSKRMAIREAVREEVELVHSAAHWNRVMATAFQDGATLAASVNYYAKLSLYVNEYSALCARLSAGGVIEMCKAIADGEIRNGFAIVRPPGHHAEPMDASGFCFFNNVAIAARWLRVVYGESIGRIMILDWDVHHGASPTLTPRMCADARGAGNGTQKAFWEDDDVLYMSLHRHGDGFYPGGTFGGADKVGEGKGKGYSVNVPFYRTGMSDVDYMYAFQRVVMPVAYEYKPDFVIVSAGFDAADGDKLGEFNVTPAGFAHMTHQLSALAGGKLVLALEVSAQTLHTQHSRLTVNAGRVQCGCDRGERAGVRAHLAGRRTARD